MKWSVAQLKKLTVNPYQFSTEFDFSEEAKNVEDILNIGITLVEGTITRVDDDIFKCQYHLKVMLTLACALTLEPVEYYFKLPVVENPLVLIVDPMLATGGSAVAAIDACKKRGYNNIRLMCLVGAPEGLKVVEAAHPDVHIYLASLDERLNEKGYIMPGLGDAGDRIFGTK